MSDSELLVLDGIGKMYRDTAVSTRALDQISLVVSRGEFLTVMGPSGCGKTALLSIIGLLDKPTEGTYRIEGTDTGTLGKMARTRERNHRFGFVFQAFHLLGDLTVRENVELPLSYRGVARSTRAEMVESALESVGMAKRTRSLPTQLSGGEQQRVALARAIVGKPLVLLADEPTGSLDSRNGDQVMYLMRELNAAGTTVILVTHDERHTVDADRVVRLFDGRLV